MVCVSHTDMASLSHNDMVGCFLQVHLVEVSPFLRYEQWKKLQCSPCPTQTSSSSGSSSGSSANAAQKPGEVKGSSESNACGQGQGASSSSSSSDEQQGGTGSGMPEVGVSELNGAQVTNYQFKYSNQTTITIQSLCQVVMVPCMEGTDRQQHTAFYYVCGTLQARRLESLPVDLLSTVLEGGSVLVMLLTS